MNTLGTRKTAAFAICSAQRHFVFGVIAQFLYVGAQTGTWSYFITYVQDYTTQPEKTAGYLLTGTLAMPSASGASARRC
jgi:fucose permease